MNRARANRVFAECAVPVLIFDASCCAGASQGTFQAPRPGRQAEEGVTMKAVRIHGPGTPDQLFYEEAPLPKPGTGEVRLRVWAAGITPTELAWTDRSRTANEYAPTPSIPGHDVSGVVDLLGPGVSNLGIGECVYGLTEFPREGTAAEFTIARAAYLAPKPRTLDHVHSAAVPLSALTAWQALFVHANLESGQRILIHGAAGGVGTFAVQLAIWRGAQVCATASARHHRFLRELGVGTVIDYEMSRFEEIVHDADVVLDTIGGETLERSWKTLRPRGTLVSLAAKPSAEQARDAGCRGIFFVVQPSRGQLVEIARLIDAGQIRPFLETVLPLDHAREAFERGLCGHMRGKIVLRVAD